MQYYLLPAPQVQSSCQLCPPEGSDRAGVGEGEPPELTGQEGGGAGGGQQGGAAWLQEQGQGGGQGGVHLLGRSLYTRVSRQMLCLHESYMVLVCLCQKSNSRFYVIFSSLHSMPLEF